MNETVPKIFYPLNYAKSARKKSATGITISATSRENSLLFVRYFASILRTYFKNTYTWFFLVKFTLVSWTQKGTHTQLAENMAAVPSLGLPPLLF